MKMTHPRPMTAEERRIMEIVWERGELSLAEIEPSLPAEHRDGSEGLRTKIEALEVKGWLRPRARTSRSSGDGETEAAYSDPILLRYFAPATRAFAAEAIGDNPKVITDLGCGPGHSTRILAELFPRARVVGLDHGEAFLSLAAGGKTDGPEYVKHDIMETPFPQGESDAMLCRFLTSHLADPQAAVETWATQLRPGGRLLIEETERIVTGNPVFRKYLEFGPESESGTYEGAVVDLIGQSGALTQVSSGRRKVRAETAANALLYRLKVQTLRAHPFRDDQTSKALDELEQELRAVASDPSADMRVEYWLRQVVLERRG